jgi:hypothetical protein
VTELRAAWETRRFEELRELAHKLKSTVGFAAFAEPAGQLQEHAEAQIVDGTEELLLTIEALAVLVEAPLPVTVSCRRLLRSGSTGLIDFAARKCGCPFNRSHCHAHVNRSTRPRRVRENTSSTATELPARSVWSPARHRPSCAACRVPDSLWTGRITPHTATVDDPLQTQNCRVLWTDTLLSTGEKRLLCVRVFRPLCTLGVYVGQHFVENNRHSATFVAPCVFLG